MTPFSYPVVQVTNLPDKSNLCAFLFFSLKFSSPKFEFFLFIARFMGIFAHILSLKRLFHHNRMMEVNFYAM